MALSTEVNSIQHIKELKNKLLNQRQKVLQEMKILRRKILAAKKAEIKKKSIYGNHQNSAATFLSSREINTMLLIEANQYFQKIEAALQRMKKGTYGICMKTGKRIPVEQLQVFPHRKYCEEARYKFVIGNYDNV